MRRLLVEAMVVASVGAVLAFAANALRPKPIELTRDYFLRDRRPTVPTNSSPLATAATTTNAAVGERTLLEELESRGLQLADSNLVAQLFRDPRYEQGLIAFVDAREAGHYQAGHVPGAYEFNYYAPTEYLPTIVPVCQMAQQLVFYCNGGKCDDSMLAAVFLRDLAAIPKEKLFVYGGGFSEWLTNRMPIEIGTRNSGQLRQTP